MLTCRLGFCLSPAPLDKAQLASCVYVPSSLRPLSCAPRCHLPFQYWGALSPVALMCVPVLWECSHYPVPVCKTVIKTQGHKRAWAGAKFT